MIPNIEDEKERRVKNLSQNKTDGIHWTIEQMHTSLQQPLDTLIGNIRILVCFRIGE